MTLDPVVTFLLLLVIGVVAGLLFDRFMGPGWIKRQVSGATPIMLTSAIVGVAGSFVGYHLAGLLSLTGLWLRSSARSSAPSFSSTSGAW